MSCFRAKTPEPGPESEDDMEVDDDDVVRLDVCKFSEQKQSPTDIRVPLKSHISYWIYECKCTLI